MPTWGQGNCSAAPGSGPQASWRCCALFYDHAASVLLPPWNAEQESFCSLFPKYLWGSASEKALYFPPLSQALLIALFEWEITSQVTNEENNKAPSGEYSGGSGLSGVRLVGSKASPLLLCPGVGPHASLPLHCSCNFTDSNVPLTTRGREQYQFIGTADNSPLSHQVCSIQLHYCDRRDQECLIHIETIFQPPKKKGTWIGTWMS